QQASAPPLGEIHRRGDMLDHGNAAEPHAARVTGHLGFVDAVTDLIFPHELHLVTPQQLKLKFEVLTSTDPLFGVVRIESADSERSIAPDEQATAIPTW